MQEGINQFNEHQQNQKAEEGQILSFCLLPSNIDVLGSQTLGLHYNYTNYNTNSFPGSSACRGQVM